MSSKFYERMMSAKLTKRGRKLLRRINSVTDDTRLSYDFVVLATTLKDIMLTRGLDIRTARLLSELHFLTIQTQKRANLELANAAH